MYFWNVYSSSAAILRRAVHPCSGVPWIFQSGVRHVIQIHKYIFFFHVVKCQAAKFSTAKILSTHYIHNRSSQWIFTWIFMFYLNFLHYSITKFISNIFQTNGNERYPCYEIDFFKAWICPSPSILQISFGYIGNVSKYLFSFNTD